MTYSQQARHPTTCSPIQGQLTNTVRISSPYFSWRKFTFLRNWCCEPALEGSQFNPDGACFPQIPSICAMEMWFPWLPGWLRACPYFIIFFLIKKKFKGTSLVVQWLRICLPDGVEIPLKLGIKPPYDPAIPLLGMYPEETKIEKDTCTPMFIAALFTIARTWKQPRCPSTDEWIKKMWYIYTMEYYSAIKRNAFESVQMRWMNLEPIIQSEVS